LRKAGIAKTPRVAAGAGAAGLGKPWVMGLSLSGGSGRAYRSRRWSDFGWLRQFVNRQPTTPGIPCLMPRKFQVNRKFWVAFGLLPVSLRIFTGAPEAQVSFSSLLVDQKLDQAQDLGQQNGYKYVDIFASSNAHTIPEKHRQTATYKKYISPDSFIATLIHETENPEVKGAPQGFVDYFSELKNIYRPTSHSPPAVVSAQLPTHTTTAVNSAKLEKHFGEISISDGTRKFGRL